MKKLISISIICISLFVTCNKKNDLPAILSGEGPVTLTLDSIFKDTSKVLSSELPVCFDSTEVLIHYIGFSKIYKNNSKIGLLSKTDKSSSYDYDYSYNFFFNPEGYFSGNIMNLCFENTTTGEQNFLTNQAVNITYGLYLRELAMKTNKHYILYQVYDKDYNFDDKLNENDLKALYISTLDGKNFTKLTADHHNFSEGIYIPLNKRYYFKTIEDTNGNNRIETTDTQHYYYLDFASEPYKIVEYNLIEEMKKLNKTY